MSTSALAYTLLSVSLDVLASPSVCTSVKISTNALPSASVCPNRSHCERVGQSVVPGSLDHLGSRQVPWSPHRQVCRQESSPWLCNRVRWGSNQCLGRNLFFSVFVFFLLLGLRQIIRLASVYSLHIVSQVFFWRLKGRFDLCHRLHIAHHLRKRLVVHLSWHISQSVKLAFTSDSLVCCQLPRSRPFLGVSQLVDQGLGDKVT